MNTYPLVIMDVLDKENPIVVLKEWKYESFSYSGRISGIRAGHENITYWNPTHVMVDGNFIEYLQWEDLQELKDFEDA